MKMDALATFKTIIALGMIEALSFKASGYVTCPIQQPPARSAVAKTIPDSKFSGGNVTALSVASAIGCYLQCQTTCLCAFANFKEEQSFGELNCEIVQHGSCTRSDKIVLQPSKGWTATKFAQIDGELKKCCETTTIQYKLNDWCQKNYPGTIPAYSESQGNSVYLWRCYYLSKDRYYYTSGRGYYSKHSSLAGIIESDLEFKSAHYVVGAIGENCKTVCEGYGKQCSPSYNTLNAVYIFHRIGYPCQYTTSTSDCFSETSQPMYFPATNKCTGFVNVTPVHDCGSYSDPNGQRLCKCVSGAI